MDQFEIPDKVEQVFEHILPHMAKCAQVQKKLINDIEVLIREKLIFRANVELVPYGSLPKFEYKAKLVRKLYEE